MAEVVSPRALTYSGTFHQWFCSGVSASRVLPTICVHICSVSQVSFHASHSSSGHASPIGSPSRSTKDQQLNTDRHRRAPILTLYLESVPSVTIGVKGYAWIG